MIISERIFEILKQKGISQKSFSEQTGIAQSTISDWKRKKTNSTADKILTICKVLNVSVYELLGAKVEGRTLDEDCMILDRNSEEFALVSLYHSMQPDEKERMLGYAEALGKWKYL